MTAGALPEQTRKGAFTTFEYQVFEDEDIYLYGATSTTNKTKRATNSHRLQQVTSSTQQAFPS